MTATKLSLTLAVIGAFAIASLKAATEGSALPAPNQVQAEGSSDFRFEWIPAQQGSGVELHGVRSTSPGRFVVGVRNVGGRVVSAVQFLTVIERLPMSGPVTPVPIVTLPSSVGEIRISPQASVEVTLDAITSEQWQAAKSDAGNAVVQLFIGIGQVQFQDGTSWTFTPKQTATTAPKAFNVVPEPSPGEVDRAHIHPDEQAAPVPGGPCRGKGNELWSAGAIVAIQNAPARLAQCQDGRWRKQ